MTIDPLVIGQLRELGGDALVHKLFRTFVGHAPVRRRELKSAEEARDSEELTRAVHSLRSSSAMLGLTELSELAGELESLADEGLIDDLVARLPELERQLDEMVELLAGELDRASPAE